MGTRKWSVILAVLGIIAGLGLLIACGGGSSTSGSQTALGSVTTVLSDPTTCGPPNGIFSHVYITVTDVKINQSATAGASDAGWVDLTPGITPKQIDLLGNPNNQCFLAQLSNGAVSLQAGSYQQIRILLATSGSNSGPCHSAGPNCVILASDLTGSSPQALQLSSQDQTGIKIPSGQIAGGQFTIAAGQAKDLDVHFDACASIVMSGSSQYRLKPVLLAGEVSLQSNLIAGALVDKNGSPLTGLTAVATLQQKDMNGIDRVKQQVAVDSATGKFSFCPLLIAGNADLVVVAYDSKNAISYAPTVITNVAAGSSNNVQMLPVTTTSGTGITTAGLSSIVGEADTTNGSAGVVADVTLSALEDVGTGQLVTIPIVGSTTSTPTVTTAAPSGTNVCTTANSDCAKFTLQVPGAPPNMAAAGSTSYNQAAPPANYKIEGTATTCTPQVVTSPVVNPTVGGSTSLAAPLNFSGCS